MKKFYIYYYRDFANTYNLYWADSPEMEAMLPNGAERITRKQAEEFARSEKQARKDNPSFAGYGDDAIYPADFDRENDDIRNSRKHELVGLIWEKAN